MRLSKIGPILLFALAFVAIPFSSARAQDDGAWQFRLRGIAIVPDESATIDPINGDISIDDAYVPELDISYLFSPNVSVELILATAKHNVMAIGTDAGDVDVGSVWILPPTLLLQYRFLPDMAVRPYLGAGINYTFFYSEDVPGDVVIDAQYDGAAGFALQGGVDIPIKDSGWFVNLDVKKVFLSTDVALNGGSINANVDVNPWVFGAGIGLIVQ
ncbi:MAG: OmpW family outer membrane protein [Gemmatimonadales bacterium]|jgi:outer membrane protein